MATASKNRKKIHDIVFCCTSPDRLEYDWHDRNRETGYLQFLEREHIEFALLLEQKLQQFTRLHNDANASPEQNLLTAESENRSEKGLQPLLAEMLILPQECLNAVNQIELSTFRLLGFGEAFDLCAKDIGDIQNAQAILAQRACPRWRKNWRARRNNYRPPLHFLESREMALVQYRFYQYRNNFPAG